MALSQAINKNAGAAPAAAPTAPKPTVAGGANKTQSSAKTENFKAHGASLRSQMSEDEKKMEGSKSDKVEFICALGDPKRSQKRRAGNQDLDSHVVVGYAFKVLEDMKVPYAPLKVGFQSLIDCEPYKWVDAKAGETVYLNNYETGIFMTQIQFAGNFTGGGNAVSLSIKFSADREDPLPVLNKDGKGSIKEGMMLIADVTEVDGQQQVKLKEGMDKFQALYVKRRTAGKGGTTGAKKNETQKNLAASFRDFLASKGQAAQ